MTDIRTTVVDISDESLFDGAKVRNIKTGSIKTIKVLSQDKPISQAVKDGESDPLNDIDFDTFNLNKARFVLVDETN